MHLGRSRPHNVRNNMRNVQNLRVIKLHSVSALEVALGLASQHAADHPIAAELTALANKYGYESLDLIQWIPTYTNRAQKRWLEAFLQSGIIATGLRGVSM